MRNNQKKKMSQSQIESDLDDSEKSLDSSTGFEWTFDPVDQHNQDVETLTTQGNVLLKQMPIIAKCICQEILFELHNFFVNRSEATETTPPFFNEVNPRSQKYHLSPIQPGLFMTNALANASNELNSKIILESWLQYANNIHNTDTINEKWITLWMYYLAELVVNDLNAFFKEEVESDKFHYIFEIQDHGECNHQKFLKMSSVSKLGGSSRYPTIKVSVGSQIPDPTSSIFSHLTAPSFATNDRNHSTSSPSSPSSQPNTLKWVSRFLFSTKN